ncbi:MAG TPA: ubiquitin-like domain-containing protein, partial [Verrucomicrobiae bacterium]|nr:ubiquitin-like domain-containing protein [Verrucomicrobiae bacterium]
MIRRTRLRVSLVLAVAAVVISLCAGSLVASPSTALALETSSHTVTLQVDGTSRDLATQAPTVAALLIERGVAEHPGDYVYPALDVPISNGLTVTYRSAHDV